MADRSSGAWYVLGPNAGLLLLSPARTFFESTAGPGRAVPLWVCWILLLLNFKDVDRGSSATWRRLIQYILVGRPTTFWRKFLPPSSPVQDWSCLCAWHAVNMYGVTFRPLYPLGNAVCCPFNKKMGELQSLSGRWGEERSHMSLPIIKPQFP